MNTTTSERMIEQSLTHLDLFDSLKPLLRKETLSNLISPYLKEAREGQTSFDPFQTFSDVKGIGIDIVSIPRITQLIKRYDRQTLTLLFTPNEIDQCQSSCDCDRAFALCFATKEAVGKALGTGLVDVEWNEIEAILTPDKLEVQLYGEANIKAKQNEIQRWIASWYEWDEHILIHILAL